MLKDIREIKECPDCASLNIIYSEVRDQVICKDCALIFEPFAQLQTPISGETVKKKVRSVKKAKRRR